MAPPRAGTKRATALLQHREGLDTSNLRERFDGGYCALHASGRASAVATVASITKPKNRKGKPRQVPLRRLGKAVVEYFKTAREASDFSAKVEADFDQWVSCSAGSRRSTSSQMSATATCGSGPGRATIPLRG